MAICYARLEYLKRTSGKNAVAKSAYNSRSKQHFQGNTIATEKTYDWSNREKPAHNQILLPSHVDSSYLSPEILWNAIEKAERKKNAVIGSELVLALPDDSAITLEDKIHLTKTFVDKHFTAKGFAAQIDIHSPENAIKTLEDDEEEAPSHNWHAHIQITSRRFLEDGKTFEKNKPREDITVLRGGRVISGPNWGKLWTQHQNEYFEEKGLSLRVDLSGTVPQKHLGPHRMRGRALSLFSENASRIELNQLESTDPQKILSKITETKSAFSKEDVDRFLQKHVPTQHLSQAQETFWNLEEIVELLDKNTHQRTALYSTQSIINEEAKILRLADRIHSKEAVNSHRKIHTDSILSKLSDEQVTAFKNLISGQKLSCVEGHAGTGKSYLLAALKDYYQQQGLKVRAFGPDNATAKVLQEKGFEEPENIHRFLFALHHNKRSISSSKEVWILDESGKLGNKPLLELLKEADKNDIHLILSGSSSQISSVERGGSFKIFCEKYGSQSLSNIQRQKFESQRQMAQSIAVGDVSQAIHKLYANKGIHWAQNKNEAIEELVHTWAKDTASFPISSVLMIARSNQEIRLLNELARQTLKERGQIDLKEYQCQTFQGSLFLSVGDRIEFRKNDKELGVTNGMSGILTQASESEFTVSLDSPKGSQKTIKFDPRYYHSYQLGYASTYFRSQGRTVDRAYVLHSPGMDKKEFYVGITRHIRTVHFFLSREQAKSLSHLKWHLNQTQEAFSTTQFTTQQDLDLDLQKHSRIQTIQTLKESDKLIDRMSGHGLTLWDSFKQKTKDYHQSKKDLSSNSVFYKPAIDTPRQKVQVSLVSQAEEFSSQPNISLSSPSNIPSPSTSWALLSEDKKNALEAYYSSCDQASLLREIVESESKHFSKDPKFAPHFREWQEACGTRNLFANQLIQSITKDELQNYFSEQSIDRLFELSKRYIDVQEKADFDREKEPFSENPPITHQELQDLAMTLDAWSRGGDIELNSAITEYITSQEDAYLFKTLSEKESKILDRELKEAPHFKEFLLYFSIVNQKADQFLEDFKDKKQDIEHHFGARFAEHLSERSSRHGADPEKSQELVASLRGELDKIEIVATAWEKLSSQDKEILNTHIDSHEKMRSLLQVVQTQSTLLGREIRQTPHFREWQSYCGLRNESASQLLQSTPEERLSKYVSEQSLQSLKEQAARYQKSTEAIEKKPEQSEKQENASLQELREQSQSLITFWKTISQSEISAINAYLDAGETVSSLTAAIKMEQQILGRKLPYVPHFFEWKEACHARNFQSLALKNTLQERLSPYFGDELSKTILSQSERFLSRSQPNEPVPPQNPLSKEQILEHLSLVQSTWNGLDESKKGMIRSYFCHEEKVFSLYFLAVTQSKVLNLPEVDVPHFKEWKLACRDRNHAAHLLQNQVPQEALSICLSPRHVRKMEEQSVRHEKPLEPENQNTTPIQESFTPIDLPSIASTKNRWETLSQDQIDLLKGYFEKSKETNLLLALMKKESEAVKLSWRAAPHFGHWKTACRMREQLAYEVEMKIPDFKVLLGAHSTTLLERAEAHRQELKQCEKNQTEPKKPIKDTTPFHQRIETISASIDAWSNLSDSKKVFFNNYLRAREISAKYHHILKIQEQVLNREWRETPIYSKWRPAFFHRNEKAFDLASALSDQELEQCLGSSHKQFIQKQVERCRNYAHKTEVGESIDEEICSRHEETINELIQIRQHWQNLSKEKKDLLRGYFHVKEQASWRNEDQESPQKRNSLSKEIVQSFSGDQLEIYLGKEGSQRVFDDSKKENNHSPFHTLAQEKQKVVQDYHQSVREATLLREIVSGEAESQGKDIREVSRFKELQKAWGERNKNASLLTNQLSSEDFSCLFGESRSHAIKDQARRFEEFQEKAENKFVTYDELEKRLLDNAETLLYRLFPDGPSRKESNKLRYGGKGSLCVTLSGSKAGSFYDFENQEGGGLLKLIEKSQGLSRQEAERWAKDFLNIFHTIQVPKSYQTLRGSGTQKESVWVSLQPKESEGPKDISKIGKFSKDYQESARYSYRDINGNLLFYTVRLVEKKDPGQKIVLPLSFGHWKNSPDRCHWNFKQYVETERPLYNLHLLKQHPNKPILIVEGEKAADAASRQFVDFNVLSWVGGSGAVAKTDWSPLRGREITIWPDNDKPGFKAADQICSELRKQGVHGLRMIDQTILTKEFHEKWDLADSLPQGKSIQDLRDMVLSSKDKALNPTQVILSLPEYSQSDPVHVARVNEVLWRVDERMRGELEKKYGGNSIKIHEEITDETIRIFSQEKDIHDKIKREYGLEGDLLRRMTYQSILFSAHCGKEPSPVFFENLKEKIRESSWVQEVDQKIRQVTEDKNIREYVVDYVLAERPYQHKVDDSAIFKEATKTASKISEICQKERIIDCEKQKTTDKELEAGI